MNKMKYPKNEIVWMHYYDASNNLRFLLTSKASRDYYYLYEASGGQLIKLGRAKNPMQLETKFKVNEKCLDSAQTNNQ